MRRLYYSDDEFGRAFRDGLQDYKEVPPVGNWRQIKNRLDQKKAWSYRKPLYSLLGVLFLVSLGLAIIFTTKENGQYRRTVETPIKIDIDKNQKSPVAPRHYASQGEDMVDRRTKRFVRHTFNNNSVIEPAPFSTSTDIVSPTAAFDKSDVAELTNLHPFFNTANRLAEQQSPSLSKNKHCTSFYLGVAVQPQHNMLFSGSVLADNRVRYLISPSVAFGLNGGYFFNRKWGIESGALLSMENQRFDAAPAKSKLAKTVTVTNVSSTSVDMRRNRITMNYYRIPLTLKYRIPWSGKDNLCSESLELLAGVQYGRYRHGYIKNIAQSTYSELTKESVNEDDLQVVTGIERSTALPLNLTVNYGLRFGYSLTQSAASKNERIDRFYRPHHTNAALNLSIRYNK